MSWNDSGNKDPWSGKKQPPDLEEALKQVQRKLNAWFKGKNKFKAAGPFQVHPKNNMPPAGGQLVFSLVALVFFILWILAGIFIVNPAEKAVILRFGKYIETVGPGPHWIPAVIEKRIVMNVDRVSDYSYSGQMLTKDENLVAVSIAVQYRIGDLSAYLFNVSDAEESLQQATSSALRQVVGTTTLDQLITAGREVWGGQVQESLVKILERYQTGIQIISVAPQPARAPENVQSAFDDAIKAQEDERRFIEQAKAYEAKVVPIAEGNAKRITQEAEAYAQQVVLNAEGETAGFLKLLPQYMQAPKVTAERMYIETMEKIMANNAKVFVDAKNPPAMYLPFMKQGMRSMKVSPKQHDNNWQDNQLQQTTVDSDSSVNQRTDAVPFMRGVRRDI